MPKSPSQPQPRPSSSQHEIVDPIWLLKPAAITIPVAVVCAWLTLCLLVYQGQWQLLLHPDTNPTLTTTLPVQLLRFGAAETGQPQLSGLWLPAEGFSGPVPTILYLPDGSGRLADDLPALTQLHQLPVNVFAFDYRGFGASDHSIHPTQARMQQDAAAALDYLIQTRHIDSHTIVPYGAGLGAALASQLAAQHPDLPAVILETPIPDAYQVAAQDTRASIVPVNLLFHERFEIASVLRTLKTPKLLLTFGPSHVTQTPGRPSIAQSSVDALFKAAQTPSFTAHLTPWNPADQNASPGPSAAYRQTILRFLNEYLPSAPRSLEGPRP